MTLWKTRIPVFVVVAVGAAMVAGTARGSAAEEPKTVKAIVKAKGPIIIDGRIDEADWKRAKPVAVNYVWGEQGVISKEPRMTVRYLWDDAYLYIGYEVFDSNLVAKGNGAMDGPPNNRRPGCEIWPQKPVDIVEFHFVFEDRNFFWDVEHNAANQFNDGLCLVGLPAWRNTRIAFASFAQTGIYWAWGEHIQDEGDRTLATAVALRPRKDGKPSTVNDAGDVDAGYTAELRLPWFGIGAPAAARTGVPEKPGPWKMAGREISILAVYQDGDAVERYFTSSPEMSLEFFNQQTEAFPRYVIKAFDPSPW